MVRVNTTAGARNARVRAEVSNDSDVRAVSLELRPTPSEAKQQEDTDVKEDRFALCSPPVHRTWMPSCGDVEPGSRTRSTDGIPLFMHSVGRLALYAVQGDNFQILHLPPDEASGEGMFAVLRQTLFGYQIITRFFLR